MHGVIRHYFWKCRPDSEKTTYTVTAHEPLKLTEEPFIKIQSAWWNHPLQIKMRGKPLWGTDLILKTLSGLPTLTKRWFGICPVEQDEMCAEFPSQNRWMIVVSLSVKFVIWQTNTNHDSNRKLTLAQITQFFLTACSIAAIFYKISMDNGNANS